MIRASTITTEEVHLLMKDMTFPARRHRCEMCEEVFVCHLCTVEEDHVLHWGFRSASLICEECIYQHELFVVICNPGEPLKKAHSTSHWLKLGNYQTFYDHLTGELLGQGCMRTAGYAWGSHAHFAKLAEAFNREPK